MVTGRRWMVIVPLVVCVTALSGLALADSFSVRATSSNTWDPSIRDIRRNDTVRWTNPTPVTHNVKSYGGNWSYSRTLPPDERVSRVFRSSGIYKFRCTLHSALNDGRCTGMCGKIDV